MPAPAVPGLQPLSIFEPANSMTAALAKPPPLADAVEYTAKTYKQWVDQQEKEGIAAGLIDPKTGWPTEEALIDAAHQYGGALMASTSVPGSETTQITGTTPMYRKAIGWLMEKKPEAKSVLDYGAGKGEGADAMREIVGNKAVVHTMEPNPKLWTGKIPPTYTDDSQIAGKYDLILNTNVLNVLPRDVRDGVVRDIGEKLMPGGHALITTRGWAGDVAATKKFEPAEEPNAIYVRKGQKGQVRVFHKGFEQNELRDYTQSVLGQGFTVEKAPFGKAGVLITRHPAAQSPAVNDLPRQTPAIPN
jgi:SAM-dependent methyltransferase